jgi:hypothetical protein
MTMEFKPGDVQFVHNHTILHDRTAFVDWPEPERRRHLLRLWLAALDARELPPVFAQRYGSGDDRRPRRRDRRRHAAARAAAGRMIYCALTLT